MEAGITEGFIAPYAIVLVIGMLAAYFCGSIPNAVIVAKRYGVNIREVGSGNTGATNVARTLGAKPGAAVMLLDAAKGALGVLCMMGLLHLVEGMLAPALAGQTMLCTGWTYELALIVASLCAIVGHILSPFLGFHGGKGASTAFGSALVVIPMPALICFAVFVTVLVISRYASVASITTVLLLPIWVHLFYPSSVLLMAYALAIVALVLVAHRSNIVRLAHHEERKFSFGHADKEGSAEGDTRSDS